MRTVAMKGIATVIVFSILVVGSLADAQDTISISGVVKSFDAATNTAVIKTYGGKTESVVVEDKGTLDKFKERRIVVGDDVKVKYMVKGGKKVSTYFRKPAGC